VDGIMRATVDGVMRATVDGRPYFFGTPRAACPTGF
jgi:hypothetical protein